MPTLSPRGQQMAGQPLRPDFALFEQAQENPYGPDNPEGAIVLCIAENLLQWDRLRDRLQDITRGDWPDWLAAYAPLAGHPDFRAAAAAFVSKHIAGQSLPAEGFCASAGATAVIELTAHCLATASDYAVFPAPAYQAYTPDIGHKAGLQRYDLTDYAAGADSDPDFHPLSTADLDRTLGELGDRFRMLVLTQPDNPTGAVYAAEQLREIADWCMAHEVHLIVNEIYALSQFDREELTLDNRAPYTSFLPLLEERASDYLHWWYSFSKDFGVSGFRAGLLYSRNEQLRSAYTNYNAPHQISTLVQWQLTELLRDDAWVTDYQGRNQRLLTTAYLTVTDTLDELGIPYAPARGSLFVWADFSSYLTAPTQEAAEALWQELFEETGVLLTAPGGLGQPEAGWFRIVYSSASPAALRAAMDRLLQKFG